jgi:hypothetical protein
VAIILLAVTLDLETLLQVVEPALLPLLLVQAEQVAVGI